MANDHQSGLRYVVQTLVVCVFLALGSSCSATIDSGRTIAQFTHRAWGPKDGAPSSVRALAQSTDGYLWLGGPDGLYRFDGFAVERYQPQSGAPLPAQTVNSLFILPNGDLWIGFRSGEISLLQNGNVTNYTPRDGVLEALVESFAQDRAGTIWATTDSGLERLEGNRWKEVGKDWNFPGKSAFAIFLDRHGTLWVSTENTLVFLPPGARQFQLTGIRSGPVGQIAQATSGKLWMAETGRSVRPIPLADKRQPPDETEVQVGSAGILFDNDGALWIASLGDGLRRAPTPELLGGKVKEFSTAVDSFTARDGLSDDLVIAILQDREGNIWTGTNKGLDCFRKTNLVPVALPVNVNYMVWSAGDAGDIWIARNSATVRVHGTRADRPDYPFWSSPMYAHRDPTGAIWWLCSGAIYHYVAGNYSRIRLPPSMPKPYSGAGMVITEDGSGVLWLAAEGEGIFHRKRGEWQRLDSASELAKLTPRTAYKDWMGRVWFGYQGGTIVILDRGNILRAFSADDSSVGSARAINGRGRHTWVVGELGLAFFDGNRFRQIIPADAEAFTWVFGVEETSDGSLWLAEKRGVIQVPESEVRQALENPAYRVKYRVFDSFDGLAGSFLSNTAIPKEIQGTDDRLWFAASGGIVEVDPTNMFTNGLPPPVLIRSVRVNGKQAGSLTNVVLPPRTTNLQIGYTALSLSVPEKVHFRYKLEEVDKDWQDAGTRREAFYTRLGPGGYHFRVIACNNDGVWNETGASLDFSIAPAYYQTNWFGGLCVAVFLALLWALYQLRVHQLQLRFNAGLEARVSERTRIARELHDTLLQNLHGLMFQFQAARNMLPRRPDEAAKALDIAIGATEQTVTDSRSAIQYLRSEQMCEGDLGQWLTATSQELARSPNANGDAPVFRLTVEGERKALTPLPRDEVYRITREILRNAFQHALASRIEAEIRFNDRELRVRIRDDGKGIDPRVLHEGGSAGHWGLRGVRERAQQIGARLDFWSEAGAGTEVELTVPAAIAYEDSRTRRRFLGLLRTFKS